MQPGVRSLVVLAASMDNRLKVTVRGHHGVILSVGVWVSADIVTKWAKGGKDTGKKVFLSPSLAEAGSRCIPPSAKPRKRPGADEDARATLPCAQAAAPQTATDAPSASTPRKRRRGRPAGAEDLRVVFPAASLRPATAEGGPLARLALVCSAVPSSNALPAVAAIHAPSTAAMLPSTPARVRPKGVIVCCVCVCVPCVCVCVCVCVRLCASV